EDCGDGIDLERKKGRRLKFDSGIVATGVGEEVASPITNDNSYWHSGNPGSYRPGKARRGDKERILISGNGDSGITELAHFLIRVFRHDHIMYFVPSQNIGQPIATGLRELIDQRFFRQIENGSENC